MPFEAIIFDLDGTLLDTLEDIADATNAALSAFGLPTHPVDAYRYFVGDGVGHLVRRIVPEASRDDDALGESLREAFAANYAKCWSAKTQPYEGIPEMLDALSEKGIRKAVLSNKPERFTRDCVDGLLTDWTFDLVLGLNDDTPRKPDPTGARRILEHWGIPAESVLYVGDTATDMKTASAAGLYPLGVLWGFRDGEELQAAGARRLASHPREIVEMIET